MHGDRATWDRACSRLREERRYQQMMNGGSTSNSSSLRDATVPTKDSHSCTYCYNCNTLGHIAQNCKSEGNKSDHKGQKIRVATVSENDHSDALVIASVASQHITKDLHLFVSAEETGPITGLLVDIMTVTTKQQGSELLKLCTPHRGITKTAFVLAMKVLYIAESSLSLFSCSN